MSVLLGAIADDLTGATDLANTLTREGMPAVVCVGAREPGRVPADSRAVVVALKSRTAPVETAVAQSLEGLAALQALGARQILFKYCSTFDSTAEGNIGPVADALLDALAQAPAPDRIGDIALVCPAFPANHRTIHQGHLFVGDRLLAESSMKDHPLTPMRDSDLVRLMAAQSRRRVGLISAQTVRAGPDAIRARIAELRRDGVGFAVADAAIDDDLRALGRAAADHTLITGGSGIALGLPTQFRESGALTEAAAPTALPRRGRAVILAGSCSTATRGQVARAAALWPHLALDAERIAAGGAEDAVAGEALRFIAEADPSAPVMVHSSGDPAHVGALQDRFGREAVGERVEGVFARIARALPGLGVGRLIVAGGETSGAAVAALGVTSMRIGPEIAPGAPWTEAQVAGTLETSLALALKSGNFGGPDFFAEALALLEKEGRG